MYLRIVLDGNDNTKHCSVFRTSSNLLLTDVKKTIEISSVHGMSGKVYITGLQFNETTLPQQQHVKESHM